MSSINLQVSNNGVESAEEQDLDLIHFVENNLYTAVVSDALDDLGIRNQAMREDLRPLHCTGLGKVILAYESEEAVQHIFAKPVYTRYTKNTITSPRALTREIQEVRKLGYAFDDEEEEMGVRCVAVPVLERTGRFLAALSVTGTVAQIPSESIGFIVRNLTTTASALCASPK